MRRSLAIATIFRFGLLVGAGLWLTGADRPATAGPDSTARLGFAQFKHSGWTAEDGAPTLAFMMAQTSDGFLWISGRTLTRFDGATFEPIPAPAGSPMENARPGPLLAGPGNVLWVGFSQGGGVAEYRGGALRDLHMPHPPSDVTRLARTPDGALWATWGGEGDRLFRLKGGRWEVMDRKLGLPTTHLILDMKSGPSGSLWITLVEPRAGYHGVIAELRPGEERLRISPAPVSAPQLAFDRAGNMWLAGPEGTLLISDRQGRPPASPLRLPASPGLRLANLAFDRAGGVWSSTMASGISYIPEALQTKRTADEGLRTFTPADGLASETSTFALADREGDIWISGEMGLDRFRPAAVLREPAVTPDPVQGLEIAAATDGTVYVASKGELFSIAPHGTPVIRARGLPVLPILCTAREGGVWAVFPNEVRRVDGARQTSQGRAFSDQVPIVCAEDREGRLWTPNLQGGLTWRDARGWHKASGRLGNTTVWDMKTAPDGDVIFSVDRRGLGRVHGDRVFYTRLLSPAPGQVSMVAASRKGLFLDGANGLARVRDGRFRLLAARGRSWITGLRDLVQTPAGDTWMVGLEGIARVRTADLDRAFDSPDAPLSSTRYDQRDGLTSMTQHTGFRGTQAAVGGDGRVWFLNRAGLWFIDPARLRDNRLPPNVVISALRSQGHVIRDPRSLTLPAGTRSLTVGFTATSLTIPDRARFRYRLDGVDEGWVDPGMRREAAYTNLGPGEYRFRVIAANNDGVWNRTGATLSFTIRPTFVQSWPFKLLCALGVAGLLAVTFRLRLRVLAGRIRAAMAERVGERERIARELHDTLLQSVQALTVRLQLVADELPHEGEARRSLEKALDQADAVIAEGRDRVRDLRPVGGDRDVVDVVESIVRRQAFPAATRVTVASQGPSRELEPLALDEIARIASEAVFNIWRHAHAARVEIKVRFRPSSLSISFADDGVGMPHDLAPDGEREGHYGLPGMRERARRLRGDLTVRPADGGGTEVTLTVPANVAFLAGRPRLSWWSTRRDRPVTA